MNKLLFIVLASFGWLEGYAQNTVDTFKHPDEKITVEPGIGTRLASIMGSPNVQLSNLLQYRVSKRFSVAAQTGFYHNFPNRRIADVKQNHSFSIFQRVGIGFALNKRRSSSAILLLAGYKYDTYSGTLVNERLNESITTRSKSATPDYGIMYNLRMGEKKYFVSSRIYVPLKAGPYGMVEGSTLDLGAGLRIR